MPHSKHKLGYFEAAGWGETWVTRAEDLVRTEFEHMYKYSEILSLVVSRNRMWIMKRLHFTWFSMHNVTALHQMYKFTPFLGLQQGALPAYCEESLSPPSHRKSSHQGSL